MTDAVNPLIERWPLLQGRIPIKRLGIWPTPVGRLDGFTDLSDSKIWVKREDLSSPLFGGNKVRKLEFLLADSGHDSERMVLTFGPLGSHHVLATAIHAEKCGCSCIAVLVPQPMTSHHNAVHRLVMEHCKLILSIDRAATFPKEFIGFCLETIKRRFGNNGRFTIIMPGASSALGTLGYVAAGLELASQVRRGECPNPRRIYVALGTGGTAAGLALGLALAGLDSQVVAVRVASRITGNLTFLHMLAHYSVKLLQRAGLNIDMPLLNISIDNRFIGPGYAHVTQEALDSIKQGENLGLALETTYTGKAFAALLADRRADPEDAPQMFINTVGPIEHLVQKVGLS
ncbi:MAG: pyridoxal-phosphate dependent enzyme [Proteobacteria bacterium]|nr:pyridoxal-phosphate dependent enzyme [Pseudomonadota bacterium]